ncbi:uncharacterized protein EAE97_003442 [Botrytis byssoidea]|uniref:Uncharacterized protein n=1 Tax=Botrytis byssoidea TaxID=139641 RepID=A0A9P5IT59_9HELO|nr:uncharacterized protein EAE97_003442 [Botrytis byssoidea]KAF7949933.1 hypothetical protein EAE97_003442 [Botrytis byssoidea]
MEVQPEGTDREDLLGEEIGGQSDQSDQHESRPATPPRELKVPKFLTDIVSGEKRPDPKTSFKDHEQPPASERLEQIKIFLADEDANRCLDFKDKLNQIQDYLTHIEKHRVPCDKSLFKDAKVMTDVQADWHDRMEKSALGDPLCVDIPQIQPYSTRLMSNEVTLAIRETKEINGTQTQIREDRPPFTVKRTKDHAVFLRAIKEDAKKTLTDLTEEEENRNLFKIENHAYVDANKDPALIPLWTDPIRGISDTGKTQSSADPWYGSGHVLGVTPKGESEREPKHNPLPPVVQAYLEAVRYYLNQYRENVISHGRGDLRHAKDWGVAALKGFWRLFPTPDAKKLERNANVYSTGQRKGDMTDEEYRAVKDDWKKYNDLQDQLLEHLSAKTTPQIQLFFDEPDMVNKDTYDPTKINITREYGERMREVSRMQSELQELMRECRDSKGPQTCNWWILGRMAEILSPVEPDIFGEVGQHWAQFKTRHIPLLWDKAFDLPSKRNWLVSRSVGDRALIDPYIQKLRDLWTTIFENEPELHREEADIENGPWIVLLPLQKGALRTDPVRHKMSPGFLQPYIFYVPYATPKPELSPELEKQLERIHRLLKAKSEQGGVLNHVGMAALRQNLAPFFYPRLRRMYDQTLSDNKKVRDKALKAFADILDPWLAGFEGVGIEIRSYKPEDKQALLRSTIPATLVDAPNAAKAPVLRQRDPSVLYQAHRRLDPDSLNTLNAQLNKDIPDDGDVTGAGWDQKKKKTYASLLGSPALQKIEAELDKIEDEINGLRADASSIALAGLQKEWGLIKQRLDEEERRTVIGVKAAANSKLKDKTIKVLQSVDFVDTDVDTDNLPGVFYLATEPPSPMSIHPTKVDTLSLVPNLDTGIHRNREKNWQQFILGYPQAASRYDTGALNFQSKAERRGIQRAAIEMALNFLASNYEQRRPDDLFRRVVIPSPWQKPLLDVPISMELEPTKRPVELDTKYYTKLMVEYTRWKDDDWYDAREKIIQTTPGFVPPPANFNGPFTIPSMFEYQDAAAKYLGNLTPTWDALLHAANTYPRPFLTAVLSRIERGVRFEPGQGFDALNEVANGMEVKLVPQELGVLRELTEPSWNCHWLPYPPVADANEDMPRQILDEFERDIEALPEPEKPPYWVSEKGPSEPPIGTYPLSQRDIRTVNKYDPRGKTTDFVPMLQLLQHINDHRTRQNLPHFDRVTARRHLTIMHEYHHIHFETGLQPELEAEFELDRVARVSLTGHPEMKYIDDRRRAFAGYGIDWDEATNTFSVQYNAAGFTGPPIIQPNLYSFIEKAAFKFGRAIAMYTQELTMDEKHYTRELSLEVVHQSYSDTMKRLEGKELYPGEPNVPPASPNPNNITLIRIASDLHKVAPDIFTDHGLNLETLLDSSVPYSTRLQYSALVIQTQVIEELNNNWESRFPIKENVWGFARDRLINPVRTVVAGRTFTEYHQPRQYFSMRRWPPCEQSPASQQVIKVSGPVVQVKAVKEPAIRKSKEKKMNSLRKKLEPVHIGGAPPNFPFGETPYQQAYQSWRITEDLKDVPEFNPKPKPKSLLDKVLPTILPTSPIDRFALPRIPPSFRPRSMPVEILRQKTIAAAQSMAGLPSLTEYYREDNEARAVRDYRQWQKENERIKMIEELAKGKSWQSMTRDERERYEGELAVIDMEEQRALQNAGGWNIAGGKVKAKKGKRDSDGALVLETGHGGKKRNRSGSAGGKGGRKKRGSRPTPIQTDTLMSGAL